MKLKPVLALAGIVLISAPGHAADVLNWRSSIEEASQHNSEVSAARQSLQSASYGVNGAYGGFLPQVTGSLSYAHGTGNNNGSELGITETRNSFGATVTASQNIFTGFQDQARLSQARSGEAAARANLQSVLARVSYDLKSAFASLGFAQGSVSLQAQIIRRREDNLRLVELRFNSGRENKGSVLLSRAYLQQARYDELQARNSVEVAQSQLARVVGRDDPSNLKIDSEAPLAAAPAQQPDFQSIALEVPAYKQAIANESSSQAALQLSRGNFYPSLGLSASIGKAGDSFFPTNDKWSVGATLSIPLFSGGKDYYAVKSAAANTSASTATRVNMLRQTMTNLKQSYTDYIEALEKYKVDESFLQAAQLRAEIARNKYNNGLITFDDWDVIENDLISREKALLQSRRDRVISEAAWEQAQGKGALL